MKARAIFLLAALAFMISVVAEGAPVAVQDFSNFWRFVTQSGTATAPFSATDFFPMVRGSQTWRVPGTNFISSTQVRRFNPGTPNTGSMSLYVRSAGSDDNDCTVETFQSGTIGPCRTVQRAYNALVQNWDLHTTGAFIDTKECGSFAGGSFGGIPVGMASSAQSGARIIILGKLSGGVACTTLTAGAAGPAVSITAGAPISLGSVIVTTATVGSPVIFVDVGGDASLYDDKVIIGSPAAGQPQIQVEGINSVFTVPGSAGSNVLSIADGTVAGAFAEGVHGGWLKFDVGSTITFLGTAAYSAQTIILENQGLLGASSTAFTNTGGVTGQRFKLSGNSIADGTAGGLTFIPGNSAGIVCSGSTYRSSTLAYSVAGACAEPQAAFVTSPLIARSTTQLDCDNSGTKCGATGVTYTNIVGLAFNYKSGKFYNCRASLSLTSGAGGGVKVKISTTAASLSSASIIVHGWNGNTAQGGGKTTAIGADLFNTNAVYTDGWIEWTMVTTADGTVQLQAAQNTADAATTSVLVNSSMGCNGA